MVLIEKNITDYDDYVILSDSDLCLDACRLVASNVIGMGELAIMTACAVAKRSSSIRGIKTNLPLILDWYEAPAGLAGSNKNEESVIRRYKLLHACYHMRKRCVEEVSAEAIIFNCTGMFGPKRYPQERLKIPTISGVKSDIKMAEQLPVL